MCDSITITDVKRLVRRNYIDMILNCRDIELPHNLNEITFGTSLERTCIRKDCTPCDLDLDKFNIEIAISLVKLLETDSRVQYRNMIILITNTIRYLNTGQDKILYPYFLVEDNVLIVNESNYRTNHDGTVNSSTESFIIEVLLSYVDAVVYHSS
jgi:hypothetical protein